MSLNDEDSSAEKAVRATRRAANTKQAEALARWGLGARGAIYLIMGLLALSVARGSSEDVDQPSALSELAHQPYGKLLVVLLAIGFAGYSLWRFSEALFGVTGDLGSTSARVISGIRGLAYAILLFTAIAVLRGAEASGADQQSGMAAEIMSHQGGRWIVGIAGAVFVGAGVFLAIEGLTRKFMRYFPQGQLDPKVRSAIQVFGVIGNVSRGAVFAGAGALVVAAAWTYDPEKAAGIDAAVELLRENSLTWVLALAALGLMTFGVYGLLEAVYRRV
jgi:hypothetical protein